MQQDVIRRFHAALPQIRAWIDQFIEAQASSAHRLDHMLQLASVFPTEVLERARMVLVDKTPFPPVSEFGLPEFAAHEQRPFDGITFKNTFFVVNGHQTLRLQFHELVHVVQWSRLGPDRFLLAYGLGLLQFGYEQSPLERMAYTLEERFARGQTPKNLVKVIEQGVDLIWNQAAPVVGEA